MKSDGDRCARLASSSRLRKTEEQLASSTSSNYSPTDSPEESLEAHPLWTPRPTGRMASQARPPADIGYELGSEDTEESSPSKSSSSSSPAAEGHHESSPEELGEHDTSETKVSSAEDDGSSAASEQSFVSADSRTRGDDCSEYEEPSVSSLEQPAHGGSKTDEPAALDTSAVPHGVHGENTPSSITTAGSPAPSPPRQTLRATASDFVPGSKSCNTPSSHAQCPTASSPRQTLRAAAPDFIPGLKSAHPPNDPTTLLPLPSTLNLNSPDFVSLGPNFGRAYNLWMAMAIMAATVQRHRFGPKRYRQLDARRKKAFGFVPGEVQREIEARKRRRFPFWRAFDVVAGWKEGWTAVSLWRQGEWAVSEGGLDSVTGVPVEVENEAVLETSAGGQVGRQQALTMADADLDWVDWETAEVVFRARVQKPGILTRPPSL